VKTLDRKLLRDLSGSGGLLLAITSIMAVGVTCFVAMQSTYHNLKGAKDRYYRQCRMADFWIDVKKVPLSKHGEQVDEALHETEELIRIFFTSIRTARTHVMREDRAEYRSSSLEVESSKL